MTVAVLKQKRSEPTSFTCAVGTAIPKGTLLKLTSPRTVIQNDTSGSVLAGVCARDKIADDGRTEVGVFTDGIFAMLVSGSTTVGLAVSGAGSSVDAVTNAPVANKARAILGHALQAGTNGNTIEIELNIGGGGIQIT